MHVSPTNFLVNNSHIGEMIRSKIEGIAIFKSSSISKIRKLSMYCSESSKIQFSNVTIDVIEEDGLFVNGDLIMEHVVIKSLAKNGIRFGREAKFIQMHNVVIMEGDHEGIVDNRRIDMNSSNIIINGSNFNFFPRLFILNKNNSEETNEMKIANESYPKSTKKSGMSSTFFKQVVDKLNVSRADVKMIFKKINRLLTISNNISDINSTTDIMSTTESNLNLTESDSDSNTQTNVEEFYQTTTDSLSTIAFNELEINGTMLVVTETNEFSLINTTVAGDSNHSLVVMSSDDREKEFQSELISNDSSNYIISNDTSNSIRNEKITSEETQMSNGVLATVIIIVAVIVLMIGIVTVSAIR